MERPSELGLFLIRSCEELGLALNSDQVDTFLAYLEHLKRWNRTINLTSITHDREIIIKHFVDSLAGLRAETLAEHASLLDIGTGAGFPGLPLKIVRPDLSLTLIEPISKKASFLHFVIGSFRLQRVKVFEGTFLQYLAGSKSDKSFNYVSTRAIRYDEIIKHLDQLLDKNGKALLYVSEPIDRQNLPSNLSIDHELAFELPEKYGKRVISVILVQS